MPAGWRRSSHGRPHTRAGARRRHVINEVLERLARADQVALGERLLHVGWLRPAAGAAPALAAAGSQHRHEGQDADGHSHCRRQHHGTHGSTTGGLGGLRRDEGRGGRNRRSVRNCWGLSCAVTQWLTAHGKQGPACSFGFVHGILSTSPAKRRALEKLPP